MPSAANAVFGVLVADYGSRFTSQLRDEMTPDRWKKRLIQLCAEYSPAMLVDGYDDAARASPDFPPSLRAIQAAVRERHIQHCRVEAATVEPPRFSGGIAGYIEHVLTPNANGSAAVEIDRMRAAVKQKPRGDMDSHVYAYRLFVLSSQVDSAYRDGKIAPGPAVNGFPLCGREGCTKHGTISMGLTGGGPWYCAKHWRGMQ